MHKQIGQAYLWGSVRKEIPPPYLAIAGVEDHSIHGPDNVYRHFLKIFI